MSTLLLIFTLVPVLNSVVGAPAVSSVHVSFVSGNKATRYAHGNLADGSSVQYNLIGNLGDHAVRKRSANQKPLRVTGRLIPRTTTMTTETISTIFPEIITKMTEIETETPSPFPTIQTDVVFTRMSGNSRKRNKLARKRVEFVPILTTSTSMTTKVTTDVRNRKLSLASSEKQVLTKTTDKSLHPTTKDDNSKAKLKETKAVKRSPYISDGFGGFPDFDEFGGNDFGSLNNFGHSHSQSHTPTGGQLNAESLAPEGVFLPPLPTQESNHIENDPYLADPETAKYASKHPPFFHEFPHKRNVLALNEQREENGLERNLLRSIRPFFAFFEINKRR